MRKELILILVGLLCLVSINAKKMPGVIVFSDKTANVTFDIPSTQLIGFTPDFANVQKGVTYYEENGDKKKLKPNDAKEIKFTLDGEAFRMVSTVKDDKNMCMTPVEYSWLLIIMMPCKNILFTVAVV